MPCHAVDLSRQHFKRALLLGVESVALAGAEAAFSGYPSRANWLGSSQLGYFVWLSSCHSIINVSGDPLGCGSSAESRIYPSVTLAREWPISALIVGME
jgi:hypothetical protein